MSSDNLRLITLNTWKGDGRYGKRLELMADGLAQLQPDIICLQESLKADNFDMDTAGYLGKELNLNVVFGPGRFKTRTVEGGRYPGYSGLAILSRYTSDCRNFTALPSSDDDPDRSLLSARFNIRGVHLVITNTHLTHIRGRDDLREKQLIYALKATQQFMDQSVTRGDIQPKNNTLSFCCGDFNFELDAEILRNLQLKTNITPQDCYLKAGGKLFGHTSGFTEGEPGRLDYILYLQGVGGHPAVFRNGRVVLAEKDDSGLTPSDHLGVMVDIEL